MTCTGDWATHHTGCACHEARGAAELARVTRERDEALATLADTARVLGAVESLFAALAATAEAAR